MKLLQTDVYLKQLKCSAALPLLEVIISDELISPLCEVTEHVMRTEEVLCLTQVYKTVLRDCDVCSVSHFYHRFVRAKLGDKVYSSRMARTDRASYICAHWLCNDNSSIDTTSLSRPGYIQYFIKHNDTFEQNGQ